MQSNDTTDSVIVIPLSRGFTARIDSEDAHRVLAHKWSVGWSGRRWYARRAENVDGTKRHVYLHRFLMEPPARMVVDHINGDGLDNRRCNLRIATQGENLANRGAQRNSPTGYKGVFPYWRGGAWVAQVRCDGRQYSLGLFATPEQAARAYDARAQELFGAFAMLNFPEDHHG